MLFRLCKISFNFQVYLFFKIRMKSFFSWKEINVDGLDKNKKTEANTIRTNLSSKDILPPTRKKVPKRKKNS